MKIIKTFAVIIFTITFALSGNYMKDYQEVENISNQYSTLIAHRGLVTSEIVEELKDYNIAIVCIGKCSGSLGESISVKFIKKYQSSIIKFYIYQIVVERHIILGFMY